MAIIKWCNIFHTTIHHFWETFFFTNYLFSLHPSYSPSHYPLSPTLTALLLPHSLLREEEAPSPCVPIHFGISSHNRTKHFLSHWGQKAAQLAEGDPKTYNRVRDSPLLQMLGNSDEDQAAHLLQIYRASMCMQPMHAGWWINLCELPWAQVSLPCKSSCTVLDPSSSFIPSPDFHKTHQILPNVWLWVSTSIFISC